MNTGMDDQLARCLVAEQEGWGLVHNSNHSFKDSIENLFSLEVKEIDINQTVLKFWPLKY